MPAFDLEESMRRAEARLGSGNGRRHRQDRGESRLDAKVLRRAEKLFAGQERPPVRAIMKTLNEFCAARDLRSPARATIYELMARTSAGTYQVAELPAEVRQTLHNLSEDGSVPGHQLAFYCLNYGGLRAVSFAAGLPWLALYQAARLRGWRPRSRGLLEAIRRVRKI
jgi:hypothetical protein